MKFPDKIPLYIILIFIVFSQGFLLAGLFLISESALGVFLAALAFSTLISVFLYKNLRPLTRLVKQMEKRGDGDLGEAPEISVSGEIGRLAGAEGKSQKKLRKLLKEVQGSSEVVQTLSSEIRAKMEKISQQLRSQSDLTERALEGLMGGKETFREMAEEMLGISRSSGSAQDAGGRMAGSLGRVLDGARHFSSFLENTTGRVGKTGGAVSRVQESIKGLENHAEEAIQKMREFERSLKNMEKEAEESAAFSERVASDGSGSGMKAIEDTVKGIRQVEATVHESAKVINRLGDRSKDIGKILEVMNEVTKQTNLLALNAAILAAQAGDHGKGFSVVATEIKSLADQSAKSTKEIEELTRMVQEEARDAVEAVHRGSKTVEEAIRLSIGAGDSLIEILQASKVTSEKVRQIQQSSSEQSRDMDAVAKRMESIKSEVKEIAAAARSQKKGNENLLEAFSELREIALEVKAATEELTSGGDEIKAALARIEASSRSVESAVKNQVEGSEKISAEIEQVRSLALDFIKMETALRELFELLGEQGEVLDAAVKGFNL